MLTFKYVIPLTVLIVADDRSSFSLVLRRRPRPRRSALSRRLRWPRSIGRLTWAATRDAMFSTLKISVMVLAILAASQAFTQLLAYTGVGAEARAAWPAAADSADLGHRADAFRHAAAGRPIGGIPLIMMTIPIFLPVVKALGYDPIWFCTAMLLNVELAQITPPFGILLYVVRGIMPNTRWEVTRAAVPIIVIQLVVMALLIGIPGLSLWLPARMLQ